MSKIPDDASDVPKADETPDMQPHGHKTVNKPQKASKHSDLNVYLLKLLESILDREQKNY
jgi:hypothetical protein